jgi:chemotaxis-related protein WspB
LGTPSAARMSTRIIVTNCARDPEEDLLLGLKAEHVTETIRRTPEELVESGVTVKDAPYLGPVTMKTAEIIQLLDLGRLLPENVLSQLRGQIAELS